MRWDQRRRCEGRIWWGGILRGDGPERFRVDVGGDGRKEIERGRGRR